MFEKLGRIQRDWRYEYLGPELTEEAPSSCVVEIHQPTNILYFTYADSGEMIFDPTTPNTGYAFGHFVSIERKSQTLHPYTLKCGGGDFMSSPKVRNSASRFITIPEGASLKDGLIDWQ